MPTVSLIVVPAAREFWSGVYAIVAVLNNQYKRKTLAIVLISVGAISCILVIKLVNGPSSMHPCNHLAIIV